MDAATITFGLGALAANLLAASAARREPHGTTAAGMSGVFWIIAALLHLKSAQRDWIFPLMALLGGLVSTKLWERNPKRWKILLALTYLVELAAYTDYHMHSRMGWAAVHVAETRLNAMFVLQLCIIGSEPLQHGLRKLRDRLERGLLRGFAHVHRDSRLAGDDPYKG